MKLNLYKNKQTIWFANRRELFIFTIYNREEINMLSKNKIKLIQSLDRKKNRDSSGLFLVEGTKMAEEALDSGLQIDSLICTTEFLDQHPFAEQRSGEIIKTDSESIRKASLQQNPQNALAIVRKPNQNEITPNYSDLIIALDFIQDPGNLGTILRIADWFGIAHVVCSSNTVDVFNPKVVQASMGAIFRIKTIYTDLEKFLDKATESDIPVYGTFLEGKNIYAETLTKNGILIMGNEGNGISESTARFVSRKLFIPSFSSGKGSESLNVAIATAICCSEFKRR